MQVARRFAREDVLGQVRDELLVEQIPAENFSSGWAEGGVMAARHALALWFGVAVQEASDATTEGLNQILRGMVRTAENFQTMHIAAENGVKLVLSQNERHETGRLVVDISFDHEEHWFQVGWRGIRTPGRWIQVRIEQDPVLGIRVRLTWDTGTGKPSVRLGLPESAQGLPYEMYGSI